MVKRVLSLDGGGVKGVIILQFLSHLERTKGIKVGEYFDMFAGTSTGALIAVLLAHRKMGASEILEKVYSLQNMQKVMYQGYATWALSRFQIRSKYDDTEKIKLIDQFLNGDNQQETRIYDVEKPILIAAYNPIEKVPIIFRNYFDKPNYSLREVCNSTSAAPTYFPIAKVTCPKSTPSPPPPPPPPSAPPVPVPVPAPEPAPVPSSGDHVSVDQKSGETHLSNPMSTSPDSKPDDAQLPKSKSEEMPKMPSTPVQGPKDDPRSDGNEKFVWAIDGGIFANNPSDLVYYDALELYPGEELKILSIGTGINKSKFEKVTNAAMGGWEWMIDDNLIDVILDSNQVTSHIRTKNLSRKNGHPYLRINEYLRFASIKIDDTTPTNYKKLLEEGDLWWRLYQDNEFIRNL